ncbi:unnamed protein product [Dracunculus medinensis]|uniref:Uncharacterized protein n=1 Tax=Dracunculus medinensis TaxID=318479 RepID=A0A0N4UMN0_DRAME|nr:unnamed protein product [Dracunculus medinensis]
MFETVIKEFNFACMATKCRPYCLTCDHCQYALEQISNFASGSKTKISNRMCPKMEACSRECLKEDVFRVVSCAKLRCTIFCFNGDCPQCSGIAKRIFVRVCRNYDIPNMPNVQFNGTCQELFSSVIKHYLDTRQSNN